MSVKELAKFIGMDLNAVYAKCGKSDIPFFKTGKQYRFKKIDILKWIKDQDQQSEYSVENYVNRYLQKHELKGYWLYLK